MLVSFPVHKQQHMNVLDLQGKIKTRTHENAMMIDRILIKLLLISSEVY